MSCEARRMAFRFRTEADLSDSQRQVLHAVRHDVASMGLDADPTGGIRTARIREALENPLSSRGFTFSEGHRAFVNAEGTAVTIHGGRAFTNNEVVWQLLELAGRPRTRGVIAVVPWTYKQKACATKVEQQLVDLSKNTGVALDLDWAAHAAYRM